MKGSYVLIIRVSRKIEIMVGKLGRIQFKEGYYAYVGSAMSGLEARLRRHLSRKKTKFWHIDYLLEKARIVDIFILESNSRTECYIASHLARRFEPVKKFGSSDCTCKGHLFYLGAEPPRNLPLPHSQSILPCSILSLYPDGVDFLSRVRYKS